MTTFNVSTSAQLLTAMKSAQGGDTISLASGTYSNVSLSGFNYSSNITIVSADADKPANFSDLLISKSSNITIADINLTTSNSRSVNDFTIVNSSKITVDNVVVGPDNLSAGKDETGLLIRWSSDVVVKNSEFKNLGFGLAHLESNGVTIENNSFHDLRSDGIRGGGTSNIEISGNTFTNFYPLSGDHPDMIQFWTVNTTKTAENIVVDGNVFIRGDGAAAQGVFMGDEARLGYKNVTISDNLIVGGLYNGITANSILSGSVTGNTVVGLPGQMSWIIYKADSPVALTGNASTTYNTTNSSQAVPEGNTKIATPTDGGAAIIAAWQASQSTDIIVPPTETETKTPDPVVTEPIVTAPVVTAPVVTAPVETIPETPVVQEFVGTANADRLIASTEISVIRAGAGNDLLTGNGSSSSLYGETGDDTYNVIGAGDKVIELADQGYDTVVATIDYTLSANVEQLRMSGTALIGNGNALDNRLIGNALDNVMNGYGGNDTIQGGDGNDTLYGEAGNDVLIGENGNDTIYGGDGNDTVVGNVGNDILYGGAGNDTIDGGAGRDKMWGGEGRDVFVFRQEVITNRDLDEIFDFKRGEDIIGLSTIDANTKTAANDAFKFIGEAAFSKTAGELRFAAYGDGVKVTGDVNGDGLGDFDIVLHGVATLSSGNFYL